MIWRAIHWSIICFMCVEMLYCSYQVFIVLQPAGVVGPMFSHAADMDPELMMIRRLYAIESWIAFVGFAIYLGITEGLPRAIRRFQEPVGN